ncbi:hypothetical protein CE91St51_26260 [[Clostridium] innocuum]|nr:hypothetical protein CE91St51_26260 [[Clostridium] innocuum]
MLMFTKSIIKKIKIFVKILGVLHVRYVYKTVYKKKEDCTYAKRDEKGVSDSLSQ